jgi:hypothetical protein
VGNNERTMERQKERISEEIRRVRRETGKVKRRDSESRKRS